MSLYRNDQNHREARPELNRGGFSAEQDPARRTMFARFSIGLKAIANLELNGDVREIMAGRVAEKLELTADQTRPAEVQLSPNFITVESSGHSLDEIRQRVDGLAQSGVINLPPEATIGSSSEDLSNAA